MDVDKTEESDQLTETVNSSDQNKNKSLYGKKEDHKLDDEGNDEYITSSKGVLPNNYDQVSNNNQANGVLEIEDTDLTATDKDLLSDLIKNEFDQISHGSERGDVSQMNKDTDMKTLYNENLPSGKVGLDHQISGDNARRTENGNDDRRSGKNIAVEVSDIIQDASSLIAQNVNDVTTPFQGDKATEDKHQDRCNKDKMNHCEDGNASEKEMKSSQDKDLCQFNKNNNQMEIDIMAKNDGDKSTKTMQKKSKRGRLEEIMNSIGGGGGGVGGKHREHITERKSQLDEILDVKDSDNISDEDDNEKGKGRMIEDDENTMVVNDVGNYDDVVLDGSDQQNTGEIFKYVLYFKMENNYLGRESKRSKRK